MKLNCKMVEIGNKNILNHSYNFPSYEAFLTAGSHKVFERLNSHTEAEQDGVLNWLEKVILEPYCHRPVSNNYFGTVS